MYFKIGYKSRRYNIYFLFWLKSDLLLVLGLGRTIVLTAIPLILRKTHSFRPNMPIYDLLLKTYRDYNIRLSDDFRSSTLKIKHTKQFINSSRLFPLYTA